MKKPSNKKTDFAELVSTEKSPLLEKLEWREENERWLDQSARIALLVLSELRRRDWKQQDLAMKMDVSAQYVSKLVKGDENLTLETICKLEDILGIRILTKSETHSEKLIISEKHFNTVTKVTSNPVSIRKSIVKGIFVTRQQNLKGTFLTINSRAENLYEEEAAD